MVPIDSLLALAFGSLPDQHHWGPTGHYLANLDSVLVAAPMSPYQRRAAARRFTIWREARRGASLSRLSELTGLCTSNVAWYIKRLGLQINYMDEEEKALLRVARPKGADLARSSVEVLMRSGCSIKSREESPVRLSDED